MDAISLVTAALQRAVSRVEALPTRDIEDVLALLLMQSGEELAGASEACQTLLERFGARAGVDAAASRAANEAAVRAYFRAHPPHRGLLEALRAELVALAHRDPAREALRRTGGTTSKRPVAASAGSSLFALRVGAHEG